MPTKTNDTRTAGPASGTVWARTKKMPVPIVAPTPNIISWNVPIERLSSEPPRRRPAESRSALSAIILSTDFLRR